MATHLRFMAEFGADFALWDDDNELLGEIEATLPITEDLRGRILEWTQEFLVHDAGERHMDLDAWDERGLQLSQELDDALGPDFTIEYRFWTASCLERFGLDGGGPTD